MSSNRNDADFDPEDLRKHLELVQAVIARLAQSSTVAKGWTLTIAGAVFGFSSFGERWYLTLLGLAVILPFSVLDMYYLHEERLFRRLYKGVCDGAVPSFSMDKDEFQGSVDSRARIYFSWSVIGFYSPLAVAGAVVSLAALLGA
ncbi:hypothetical protein [Phytohabitans aurantiacus]|jgi:hypothetical protein|uniref:Uncharacterized protein n=1 Tax=Phytohabitans aurantiacus TaxID=3016789 RepID=A0ABQ5QT82_9ACTN|nr:hypothetical protein [Phytohabitans aurantiacus]GLH97614.1 hypothetical protein Pa4123_28890 [Phytohabitans aurantiacus]